MKFDLSSAKTWFHNDGCKEYETYGFVFSEIQTSGRNKYRTIEQDGSVELKSLDELINLSKHFNCDLVVSEGYILIYDHYMES